MTQQMRRALYAIVIGTITVLAGLAWAPPAGASRPAPDITMAAVAEDSPAWNCATMGNGVCGTGTVSDAWNAGYRSGVQDGQCLALALAACGSKPWAAPAGEWEGAVLDSLYGDTTVTVTDLCVVWVDDTTYAVCPDGVGVS